MPLAKNYSARLLLVSIINRYIDDVIKPAIEFRNKIDEPKSGIKLTIKLNKDFYNANHIIQKLERKGSYASSLMISDDEFIIIHNAYHHYLHRNKFINNYLHYIETELNLDFGLDEASMSIEQKIIHEYAFKNK